MQELTRPAEDSLAHSAMPAAVWAARDSLAAFFSRGSGSRITVTRSSGRVPAPYGDGLLTTCRVTIHGAYETKPYPYDQVSGMIEAYLEDAGWVAVMECSPDGPDGTFWGMRRGGLCCLVMAEWDSGGIDSTYVPSPEYVVVVDVLPDRPDICPH